MAYATVLQWITSTFLHPPTTNITSIELEQEWQLLDESYDAPTALEDDSSSVLTIESIQVPLQPKNSNKLHPELAALKDKEFKAKKMRKMMHSNRIVPCV